MSIISEAYKNKLMRLAGVKTESLNESSRIDFLKNDFTERIGRKYDKFIKFYSKGDWSVDKEPDKFIKNILWNEKLVITKGNKIVSKERFLKEVAVKLFADLDKSDPTENKQYLNWLINIFLAGNLPTEDFYKAHEVLTLLNKNKDKLPVEQRNINSFTDIPSIAAVVEKFNNTELTGAEKEKLIKLEGAEQVYDDENWKIIIPKTKDAACLYGKSTKWCTAATGNDYNRFEYYNKQGPLYILIDKRIKDDRDVMKKLQFHFESNQFMDTLDRQINVTKFFKANPDLMAFFKKRGEIDASFAIERMLVSKEEGLKLLGTTEAKIGIVKKKSYSFFEEFFIEIGATKELIETILHNDEFIKAMFESNDFTNLMSSYEKLKIKKEGLKTIKTRPWLSAWIMSNGQKENDTIQSFVIDLFKYFGSDGKKFATELMKKDGIIWKSLIDGAKRLAKYFNIFSRSDTFGEEGVKIVKASLRDANFISELKAKGISNDTLEMVDEFYFRNRLKSEQARIYYKNILS